MGRPEDEAWTNTGSVWPPMGRLVGAGGYRIEACRQSTTIDRWQPFWTSNPAYGYVHFSCGEHTFNAYQELSGAEIEYCGHLFKGILPRFCKSIARLHRIFR